MSAALKLWSPPIPKHRQPFPLLKPNKLLDGADLLWESDDARDWLIAGFLCRAALEAHLRLECQRHKLNTGRFDPLPLRLFREGHLTFEELNEARRLLDVGSKACHNHPFTADDARLLYEDVAKFVG